MRDRLEARILEVVEGQAMTGSPSAIRMLIQMLSASNGTDSSRKTAEGLSTAMVASAGPSARVFSGKKKQRENDAAAAIAADPDLFVTPATRH